MEDVNNETRKVCYKRAPYYFMNKQLIMVKIFSVQNYNSLIFKKNLKTLITFTSDY